ncbi:MAG TPA: hypothetical protein VHO72_04885, partial [Bacteroidales bacterium]|nr:hypothetical protein [Bacteroidales bacterium]
QEVQWPVRLASLNDNQEKFLKKINKFMEKSPNARLSVLPITYEEKEKEYILYFEAKKRYYLAEHKMRWASFESKDSTTVERMSVKDSHFIRSMLKYLNDTVFLFTTRQKCAAYLGKIASPDSQNLIKQGEALVNMRYSLLRKQRENKFLSFFNKDEVKQRIIFLNGQTEVPFNGFSFYKLTYKNDIPDDLRKVYLQMLDL